MVADCGGGTVDITVYEMAFGSGKLKELYKATGGPFGSMGNVVECNAIINGPICITSNGTNTLGHFRN